MPVDGLARRLLLGAIAAAPLALAAAVPACALPGAAHKADEIVVLKSARRLFLLRGGAVLRSYPIALGPHAVGPKRAIGDGRTPEGSYVIDGRNPRSAYHLALHISYPNAADVARAAAAHADPGGAIFLHGLPAGFGALDPVRFTRDWTEGCISVSDRAIEEIWRAVADGTPIEIRP